MSCPDFHLDKLYFDSFKGGEDNADSMDFSVLIDTEKAACSLQGKYEGKEGEIAVIAGDKEHCEKYISRTNQGLKCSKKTFDDLYFDDFEGGSPYDRLSFNIRANTRGLVNGVPRCVLRPDSDADIDCTAGFDGENKVTCTNKPECKYVESSRSGSCTVSGEYYGEKRHIYSGGTNEICEEFNLQHGEKVTNNEIKQIIDESISSKAHDVYKIKARVNNNKAAPTSDLGLDEDLDLDPDPDPDPELDLDLGPETTGEEKKIGILKKRTSEGSDEMITARSIFQETETNRTASKEFNDVLEQSKIKGVPYKLVLVFIIYMLFLSIDFSKVNITKKMIETTPTTTYVIIFIIFCILMLIGVIFLPSQLYEELTACDQRITGVEEEDQEEECESNTYCKFESEGTPSCVNKRMDEITELNIDGYSYLKFLILFFITMLSVGFLVSKLIDETSFYNYCMRSFNKERIQIVFLIQGAFCFIITLGYILYFIDNTFHFINLYLIKDISEQNSNVKCYKERNSQVECCSQVVNTCDVINTETGLKNVEGGEINENYVINPDIYHNKYMISLYPDYKYLSEIFTIYKEILFFLVFIILFIAIITSSLPKIVYEYWYKKTNFKYTDNSKLFVLPGLIILYILINVLMFSVSTDNPLWYIDTVDVVNFFISTSLITISLGYCVKHITVSNESKKLSSNIYLAFFVVLFLICFVARIYLMLNSNHLSEIYRLNYFENKKMLKVNWKDYNDSDISVKQGVAGSPDNNRYGSGIKTYHGLNNHFRLTWYIYLIISLIITGYAISVLYAALTKDKNASKKSQSLMIMIISFSIYNLITHIWSDTNTFTESPRKELPTTDSSGSIIDKIDNFKYKEINPVVEEVATEDTYYSSITINDGTPLNTSVVEGWREIVTFNVLIMICSIAILILITIYRDNIFGNAKLQPQLLIVPVLFAMVVLFVVLNIIRIYEMDIDDDTGNYTYYENCTDLDILPINLQDKYTYRDVGLDMYIDNEVTEHIKTNITPEDITSNMLIQEHIFSLCLKNK